MLPLRTWFACGLAISAAADSEEHVSLLQTMAIKRHVHVASPPERSGADVTCDFCFKDETRYPEGLNGKCTKKIKRADKKTKTCERVKKTERVGITEEKPRGRIKHQREVRKCCKGAPCDNPCPDDTHLDESAWKGKCAKIMARAQWRAKVCGKIHGRGKYAGKRLQKKFADKCCMPGTTTTDDTVVATTTTPAPSDEGTTLSPEAQKEKEEKERKERLKCGQDYKVIVGYTNNGFKQVSDMAGFQCAKLCDKTPRCNGYEYLKSKKLCHLQDKPEPTHKSGKWEDANFCQKPADRRAGPCEDDYDQVLGYVNGGGTIKDVASIDDTLACAELCNNEKACNSYEYWYAQRKCELNWNEDLTHGKDQERSDFAFCIKAAADQTKICKKGYVLASGQVAGAGQITTTTGAQEDPSECAELCDNDPACNSYEYSLRYERCELNYRPEPNNGGHWYDMHLCSKPERRRADPCPNPKNKETGYIYKLGQLSGSQFVTKTSVKSLDDCAAECEKDPRCNSFEYSQTHDRCELNNADIPNSESEWYDMKFCQKPEARRAKDCGEEYTYVYGRVPGGGSKQRIHLPTTNHSSEICAEKCDALEECRSYEYDVMLRYCDLNWQPEPTSNSTENNFKFCTKAKENRATSCKGKYTRIEGQIPGHGQVLYKDGLTADACADLCDSDGGCNSYEYSHMYNRCEINYAPEPSSLTYWVDMVFCSKAEEDREPACNSQYEYKAGQLSGHQYVTLTLHTMEECADKCSEDARCNAYEYSWKYNRCELNNKDETNSATEWYDMKFCYKPEDMRDPPCSEDYEQVAGYIPGAQVRTIGSVPSTRACAEHCAKEDACMSYEYTVMGRACEMHWAKNVTHQGVHAGYVFCMKAPEDRSKSCVKGFTYMPGQRTGSSGTHIAHMDATTLQTAEECATKCADDKNCYSYEYSHTYNRCERLYRPIPNAVSTWYDMRFCQKPEKDWQPTCASDYEYKVGHGSSYHTTTQTFESCQQLCEKDPRCNMYGYSRMHRQCQLSIPDVPNVANDWYDIKWCVKPLAKRPKDCASNYDYIYGRVPGGGFKRTTRSATMMNTNDCAKLCDSEEACRSYEYDINLGYCDMNYQPAPTHNSTENNFKFCSKKENKRATSCQGGYIRKTGQIPGHGQILYKDGLSADECQILCSDDDGCNSYEYSHVYNRCELNYQWEPTSTTLWYDMVFCEKPEEERHPFCIDQYEYKAGQRSGSQYATITIQTMEECGEKCSDDPRCNAYEYSHRYKRCELNNIDTINTASEWYDMKFCYKPEALRDGPCGEEYDRKEGYTPGAQVKTIGAVVDTAACAKLCDDEDACRSYEYNVMARACELHWNPEPTHTGVHAGYVFCQMPQEDRAKSCKLGFNLLAGQRTTSSAQYGHIDVTTLQTADECAKKCDDDETCFSYEYSHTYNRCERLWRPIPNSASTWYDQRFCQKPEKKWQVTCASDYEYKVGRVSYYATANGVDFDTCAKKCDDDPRCNMYGYSRKYKWCWFDKNDVPNVNDDYYDMKFCRKPDARRPKDCAKNYDYIFGRVPGGGSSKRVTRTATMMNTDDCAKACDENDGCRSYEYDVSLGYCDMNWQPAPTHNDTENAFKFCSKKENDRAVSCVGDYVRKSGAQFGGAGTVATTTIQTAEQCAKLCDDDGGCNSYEYSWNYKRCERNYAADPNSQTTWYDMVFCQKPEKRREAECDERYEYKTGQLSGQQYITVTKQSMQECADQCTDDARCNSYEYSWRHRRCELNHPDVTNTETLWYDMKFCYKPLDMRMPDCGEEYDEVIGHVPGGGSIKGIAAVGDALDCAQLCDDAKACMSYEYSVMAQRCELNWNKEPTSPAIAAGYHFCQKSTEDRAKMCVNGYELIYGQYNNAGGAQIGATKSNVEDPADCAKDCDSDKNCFSYEYSATYKKCELNAYPEPNLDTHWYDMRFCAKPKNKRADLCEKDYSYKLGQMSGQQFVTQTLTQASACAKLCDDDSRCNAYEFSQRYNRCELNYMDTTNSLSPWYDMHFCAKPKKQQQADCAKDYDYVWGRVPGGGFRRTTNILHTDDCAKKCDDEEACRSYEYDPRIKYCDMNYQSAPTHNDTENNFKFCSKAENNMATTCRNDYVKMEGQIPGHGQIRYFDGQDAENCAKMCDKEDNCFSYEYSHLYNRCELNYRPTPTTTTKWYDMVFCAKPENRQPDACIAGYEYLPGQLNGQQFLTVTIQTMKECGAKCTRDARCNSYEYSFKYKRCELNNNPHTNHPAEWYDMKFCQKAEEDREAPCSEDYVEVEGYINGKNVRAVGAVENTHACSKLCDDETACKSYEYSIMAKRCELNWEHNQTTPAEKTGVQAGYHLCVKDESDREKACQNGYELMEGQMAGGQYKTLTFEKPEDCAKECDKENNCNSYEFSFTYNRCEINYVPEPNNPSHWYDMRFCAKPKSKRSAFCPGDYKFIVGQRNGQQYSTLSGITSLQACAQSCDSDSRCNSFEYSFVYKRCELNWYDIPNHPHYWYDNKFCQKSDKKRQPQCGPGYDNLYGRVPGSGFRRLHAGHGISDTKSCAKACDDEEGCRSYEFHPMGKYCDMNYQPLPTQNFTEAGFDFCSKQEKNRADKCLLGFEFMDGQLAGYQYQTLTNIDDEACAKMCQSNKMCNSYEYSHVYNRCELNWQPKPNSATRWYDLKFCMKPASKREDFCDGDYKHMDGQLNGQQFVTLTISSMKDCARECNKDPRCRSYEYSSKYSRCELNYATVPNHPGYWYDLKFCQKPVDLYPENCSEAYEFDVGQFNGGGNIKTVGNIFTTDDCAALCDDETACKSYEHSVNARACQLNWAPDKNNNNSAAGYHFCKKASDDVAKACKGDYVMMPGQVNGLQFATTTQDTAEKCKELCDDDKQCNSYEYSMHYNRCELNYRPLPNHEGHWYDMKFCAKPESKQEPPCTKGYKYYPGQLSGHQFTTATKQSIDECADACDADDRCNSYEFSLKYKRCELNYWSEPSHVNEWYDMKFCQRPWKDRPVPCAEKYTHLRGAINGAGQIISHNNNVEIQSTEECAEACDDDNGCNSYEYSVHHKQCHLNYDAEVNNNNTYMDFTFCQKDKGERYEPCQNGYVQKPGQLSGRQYVTLTTILKPEECADLCDDDDDCNSYEYSHKYNRCELNWRPEPSHPTYWYDMKFCAKPVDRRKNICENGYNFTVGQVSGTQYLTRTGIELKECAKLCDDDLRCNSYEYSNKYVRCELNYQDEPTHDTEWYDMKMCIKPKDKQDPPCHGKYEFREGQIRPGQIIHVGAIVGSKECAELCDEKEGCRSYEYSYLAKQCQLNWDAEPDYELPQAGLFKMCTRHADEQDTVCGGGYTAMAGQNSQGPTVTKTSFEEGPSGCQKLCDEDETCFAFEHSYKYKRCELNWRTEPNTESRWYDLQFCQKPKAKWPKVCAEGFSFMEGQTTSQYEVKTNIHGTQACADFCAREQRCLSYEYSPKYLRCELNTVAEPNIPNSNWYDLKFCSKTEQ